MRKFKNWLCRIILKYNNENLLDLRQGEHVFYWQEDPSKIQQARKSGKWLKVEIIAVKGSMAVVNTGASLGDRWTLWISKNFRTRVSEQERCVALF